MSRAIERIWLADGAGARLLTPLSWIFAAAVQARNLAYDLGLLRTRSLGVPTVSVGNLAVGGTGKTPVSAWVAGELRALGASPAVLLRGYGDDEPLVHERLLPGIPVIADPDRVAAAARARARGANVLVLDDAFQHRRAARDLDLVLVAAEQRDAHRMLPAGPLREGPRALRRASLVIVTRKSASSAEAEAAAARWTGFAGAPESVIIHLRPRDLRPADPAGDGRLALDALGGRRVLAISAIGAPEAFEAQLAAAGAVAESAAYPDHHPFTDAEVAALARRAASADLACCTLKDAAKLWARWPRQGPPLWYLSQAVEVERGAAILRDALRRLVPGASPRATRQPDPPVS
ncbi:MAG: tetraacyldisaccharide 4'-kinase [Gemmatimonadaceae bacterium]